ncbi:MAG: endo-1,4-beta-xylanase, partial [Candidatus Omnitrophota bacterium]
MNGCCPRLRIFIAASALLFFTVGCARSFVAEGDSPFGVCVDLYECRNESIPGIIQECGIGWVRQVVRWDLIEPVKGDFKWKDLDDAVDRASEKGINIYGQFLWKAWSDPTSGDPEAIKNWVNFVAKAVARYKDKIKHWEVWNEPDFDGFWKPTSADNYVKLLKATYATAKAVDPDCRIILGGLMGWGGEYP